MFRRIIILVICIMMVFTAASVAIINYRCENKTEASLIDILPMSDHTITIYVDKKDKQIFKLHDVDYEYFNEYNKRIQKNQNEDVKYESDTSFGAYISGGKYWVETNYFEKYEYMIVTIETVEKYK